MIHRHIHPLFVRLAYGDCTADVIFVVDSSASVGSLNWYAAKQAVMDIVQGLKVKTFGHVYTCMNLNVSCHCEKLSILFLPIITVTRIKTMTCQFSPLVYGPIVERILLRSNLLCPFAGVK